MALWIEKEKKIPFKLSNYIYINKIKMQLYNYCIDKIEMQIIQLRINKIKMNRRYLQLVSSHASASSRQVFTSWMEY